MTFVFGFAVILFPLLCFFAALTTAAQTASNATIAKVPTCLQPRAATDPAASLIASPLSSAIPQACNSFQANASNNELVSADDSYKLDSFEFHVDSPTDAVYNETDSSNCPSILNTILQSCILVGQPAGTGFWGGWVLQANHNWSIVNLNYPNNGLLLPSTSSAVSAQRSAATGNSGTNVTGSSTASTWSYTWQSSDRTSSTQQGTGLIASSRGFVSSQNATNSATIQTTTLATLNASIITSKPTASPTSSNGTTRVLSVQNSTATITTTSYSSLNNTSSTASISASSTSYLPLAAYSLSPSGTSIAPNSPAATDAAVVVGTLLLALAAALALAPLAEAAADAAAAAEVDTVIAKIEPLFADLGGDSTKDPCGGAVSRRSSQRRQTNPFPNLGSVNDITDIAGCADEILQALKSALTQTTPDAALANELVEDLKQLANNAQEVKQNPSQSGASLTSTATSTSQSSSSSSSSGCTGCCTWETAATDNGIAAITPAPSDFNDIDDSLKRDIPERFQRMGERAVEKRASTGQPILSFKGSRSSCSLTTPPGLPAVSGYVQSFMSKTLLKRGLTRISRLRLLILGDLYSRI